MIYNSTATLQRNKEGSLTSHISYTALHLTPRGTVLLGVATIA